MCTCEEGYDYNDEQKYCVKNNGIIIGASIGGAAFLAFVLASYYLIWNGYEPGSSSIIGARQIVNNHNINMMPN